jgi:hypothetical protein
MTPALINIPPVWRLALAAGGIFFLGAVTFFGSHPTLACGTRLNPAWIECVAARGPLSPREELLLLASEDSGMRVCGNLFLEVGPPMLTRPSYLNSLTRLESDRWR